MIGYLHGIVIDQLGKDVVVLVGGVGYRVTVTPSIQIEINSEVSWYVHTHVKEDALTLYGFAHKDQLHMFEMLLDVSGVGPKMALGVLAQAPVAAIRTAIATAEVGFFTKISGIGKKNAQRIIVDLKSKIGSLGELDLSEPESGSDEVFDALVAMGFDARRVSKVLADLPPDLAEDQRLKQAIRHLSS